MNKVMKNNVESSSSWDGAYKRPHPFYDTLHMAYYYYITFESAQIIEFSIFFNSLKSDCPAAAKIQTGVDSYPCSCCCVSVNQDQRGCSPSLSHQWCRGSHPLAAPAGWQLACGGA